MPIAQILEIIRDLFLTTMLVALPALAVSLIVGVVVSILQVVTSIQDQTLSYVPRVILVGVVIVVTMGLALELAIQFTQRMMAYAARAGAGP